MLIVANGAFKSGSTWQFNILKQMTGFEPIPEAYRGQWVNPTIEAAEFANFLRIEDFSSNNYISKNHFPDKEMRNLLFAQAEIRVFNIKRDLRDVLVSAYYHNTRKKEEKPDFATFYYGRGRDIARRVLNYHRIWEEPKSQHYFVSSYEGLHLDFRSEILKIAAFLSLELDDIRLAEIEAATKIEKLREDYGENDIPEEKRFFRKGKIGDWQNHFDQVMLADLAVLEIDFERKFNLWHSLQRRLSRVWRSI